MHIALYGVERVGMFGKFVFNITVNIVERGKVGGFPVVGAVDDGVFQVAVVVAGQVVEVQYQLLTTA